jgi:hypothetical protein
VIDEPEYFKSKMPPPTLSDDDILLVTRALEHYNAYLLATQRHDPRSLELAEPQLGLTLTRSES